MSIDNLQSQQTISLGRQREMDTTVLEFNLAPMAIEYGTGTAVLVHKRSGDSRAYIATTTQEGNLLTWRIGQADTWYAGKGEAEIRWMVNTDSDEDIERIAKTAVFTTMVTRSIVDETEQQPGGIVYCGDLSQIKEDIGALDDLTTTAKSSLVAAINEAAASGGGTSGTGWTSAQITLLETVLQNLAYSSASAGQTAAASLISSLRGNSGGSSSGGSDSGNTGTGGNSGSTDTPETPAVTVSQSGTVLTLSNVATVTNITQTGTVLTLS